VRELFVVLEFIMDVSVSTQLSNKLKKALVMMPVSKREIAGSSCEAWLWCYFCVVAAC
jgi:hypothetical protein